MAAVSPFESVTRLSCLMQSEPVRETAALSSHTAPLPFMLCTVVFPLMVLVRVNCKPTIV